VGESSIALAHSLAGNSATVGYTDLSALARSLEHALERSRGFGRGREGEPELFAEAGDEIRRLLHQFAAGFLRPVAPELVQRLADHERWPAPQPLAEPVAPVPFTPARESAFAALEDDEALDAVDAIDDELFPIFEEEADELLPQLQARLRDWAGRPDDREAASACMRTLHTFKGGARLAGAMRVGEMAHRLETSIEELLARDRAAVADIEPLLGRVDAISAAFEALRHPGAAPAAAPVPAPVPAIAEPVAPLPEAVVADELAAPPAPKAEVAQQPIDWARFPLSRPVTTAAAERPLPASSAVVRVRGSLLDRLVNQAGEVSIARARIDADVRTLQGSLNDLTDSLDRLRRQLRDIELQAETQLASRLEAAKQASANFDPLEMDRFTRFQELTRFMAESVNDVATLQRSLQRTLQSTEDELASQARVTRELQDDLLRTRMIEFESLADRLYRVVRQASKDTGKQVRLDIVGGAIEIDRGVLERMTGPFEHLLRNSVVHGIELPDARAAAGKERGGSITVSITQEGNEVGVEVRDDGAGLDLPRIRARAIERGLLAADATASDAELAQLIFAPGFSTAESVTELAGRGVGMDVVRAEVDAMGGRIETATRPGQGTAFRLLLPLTTAVTQVVMLRCGDLTVAVPSTLIEIVRRCKPDEIDRAYATAVYEVSDELVPFYWLGALLQAGQRAAPAGRSQPIVVIRSAAQRVALHVDEVVGNQEVVVKNVGPQLARLPGLAGVTLLPSGQVALIYNPVALATLYGPGAQRQMAADVAAPQTPEPAAAVPAQLAPMVMVVDDSLTVRRVTQRLLVREGYRVVTAKDGLEALERLAEERPAVLLSDIEMPRMDGFDLARNVRADARLAGLPIVMITSRIAQKHRDYAASLGVDHYLGKPYSEEELLSLVARYAGADVAT
jgi:chemosensory pili system protein ChpA (sensor histidine kinase/response regulator)